MPQSALGLGIRYVLDQWNGQPWNAFFATAGSRSTTTFAKTPSVRPTVVGKKNRLFIGAAEAGPPGAILHNIVESCRRRGVDPLAYLRDVLTRLPKMLITEVASITPEAWAKAQRQPPELKTAS